MHMYACTRAYTHAYMHMHTRAHTPVHTIPFKGGQSWGSEELLTSFVTFYFYTPLSLLEMLTFKGTAGCSRTPRGPASIEQHIRHSERLRDAHTGLCAHNTNDSENATHALEPSRERACWGLLTDFPHKNLIFPPCHDYTSFVTHRTPVLCQYRVPRPHTTPPHHGQRLRNTCSNFCMLGVMCQVTLRLPDGRTGSSPASCGHRAGRAGAPHSCTRSRSARRSFRTRSNSIRPPESCSQPRLRSPRRRRAFHLLHKGRDEIRAQTPEAAASWAVHSAAGARARGPPPEPGLPPERAVGWTLQAGGDGVGAGSDQGGWP